MASIGDLLRQAREAQGRSVADLATELCLTERYLLALEENDIKILPGLFFYQSFARQYAAILGLDADEIRNALAALAGPPAAEEPQKTVAASPFSLTSSSHPSSSAGSPPSRLADPIVEGTNRRYFAGYPVGRSATGLVAAVLLGSGIFAWWNRAPQTAPATASVPAKAVETPLVSRQGDPPALVASPDSSPTLEATAAIDDGNQVVLNLSATEETWLSITSHGKVIFSGILEPSQSKTLKGAEVATMRIGNAGGVDIEWNGKSIGPIGPRGQVRTVRFTSQDFHVLPPDDQAPAKTGRDNL